MGVASAALVTGFLVDASGWRSAFIIPGALSISIGLFYLLFIQMGRTESMAVAAVAMKMTQPDTPSKDALLRIFANILFTTAVGGLVFQSTTFTLPKVFDERLTEIARSTTLVGTYAFLVFSLTAFAQLFVGYLVLRQGDKLEYRTTPNRPGQGAVRGEWHALSKDCNTGLADWAGSLRASREAVICVVALV